MADEGSNVVQLVQRMGDGYHIEADTVLEAAKGKLTNAVVVGWDTDRNLYFASSDGAADANLLLDLAKQTLIEGLSED